MRVGLTGGIGSGKSAVLRLLAERGAVAIDADAIARAVVEPGTPGLQAVVDEFGPGILRPDGSLDRAALATLVFPHPANLARLEAIVHPLVRARRDALVAAAPDDAVVVEDIPLLVEKGHTDDFDVVVVVIAPLETRVDRLTRLRGLAADDVRSRVAAQASDEERIAAADIVIDNGGTVDDLAGQVDALWQRLTTG